MKKIMLLLLGGLFCSGCVVVYQPSATKGGLVLHEQTGSPMNITETVPVSPKLADQLTGISASASATGNTIASPTVNAEAKLK